MTNPAPTPAPAGGSAGRSVLSVIETTLVLGVALILSVVLSLMIIAGGIALSDPTARLTFPLESAGAEAWPDTRLIEELRARGHEDVSVDRSGPQPALVVDAAMAEGVAVRVNEVLDEAGYRTGSFTIDQGLPAVMLEPPERLLQKWVGPLLIVQALVFVVLGALLIRFRVAPDWRPRAGAGLSLLFGVAAALAAFGLSYVLGALMARLGFPVREQEWVLELAREPGRLLRLAPLIVLVAPFAEEVLLRGYVFRFLDQRVGPATAYATSAILFALIHFNPSGFVIYVTIGLVLAFVYRWTGNLLAPVVGHACFNGLVLLGLIVGEPPV